MKGFVIYSLVPACTALLRTMEELRQKNNEEKENVGQVFSRHFRNYKSKRLLSFLFAIIMIVSYSSLSLVLLNKMENNLALILTILFIYLIAINMVIFTYTIFYLGYRNWSSKEVVILAFISMVKHFMTSIYVLIVILILLVAAYINFLFFLITAPFLYGMVSIRNGREYCYAQTYRREWNILSSE
ncbi:hypothetical protein ACA29_07460 [Lederbergia galactosidilytica]|uniref:DUF624 domain-containing protein n=1 Tax=Lederbergia galactosidilytica TaxID=217031 RepID=A0A0Q9YAH3_9BACI|nr:hypothetical protein ACA29_07460 [Lederbergia galactosidilytica]